MISVGMRSESGALREMIASSRTVTLDIGGGSTPSKTIFDDPDGSFTPGVGSDVTIRINPDLAESDLFEGALPGTTEVAPIPNDGSPRMVPWDSWDSRNEGARTGNVFDASARRIAGYVHTTP